MSSSNSRIESNHLLEPSNANEPQWSIKMISDSKQELKQLTEVSHDNVEVNLQQAHQSLNEQAGVTNNQDQKRDIQITFSDYLAVNSIEVESNCKVKNDDKKLISFGQIQNEKSQFALQPNNQEGSEQSFGENKEEKKQENLEVLSDNIFLQNVDQSRSISVSGKVSQVESNGSCSESNNDNSFTSSSSDSSCTTVRNPSMRKIILDQIPNNSKSFSSALSPTNSKNKQNSQMKISLENYLADFKTNENPQKNKTALTLQSPKSKKERMSIFSSQNFTKKSILTQTQKNSINSIPKQQISQSSFQSLRFGEQSPQSKRFNYMSPIGKQSIDLSPSQKFSMKHKYSFGMSRESIRAEIPPEFRNSLTSESKAEILYGFRRRALRSETENNDRFFNEMQKQSEVYMNVYQLENPTFEHAAVQQFFKDIMPKVNKTPKEKNLIKRIIEKLGYFEKQKDIIFKNQNTNDTLFNNLNIEEFEKHQCIFHQGEFGYKYYIIIQGGVHLLLPQMEGKAGADNSLYVSYMNSIQQSIQQKNEEQQSMLTQDLTQIPEKIFRQVNLWQCGFMIRCFLKNTNKMKIKQWVKDIGNDEKKITLLFGGLDHEKRLLINATFLEGREYVNIFYPNMVLYKTFLPGEGFGEIALLTKQRRTATMICSEKTFCLTLSKQGFDQIIGVYQTSMIQNQVNFLQQFSFIEKIPKSKLLSIIHDLKKTEFSKGHIIYKEGDPADNFYFIIDGEFEISKLEVIEEHYQYNPLQKGIKTTKLEYDGISDLNWTQKIKKAKRETKRIPIVILQSNQYFGQNEIMRQSSKRETKAVCSSLTGTLYSIQKSILLYHLNNWNGMEELRMADNVINNWSYNRISQIKELSKIKDNQYSELWRNPVKLKKKKRRLVKQITGSSDTTAQQTDPYPSELQKEKDSIIQTDEQVNNTGEQLTSGRSQSNSYQPLQILTTSSKASPRILEESHDNKQKKRFKKVSLTINTSLLEQNNFGETVQEQVQIQQSPQKSNKSNKSNFKEEYEQQFFAQEKISPAIHERNNNFQTLLPSMSLPSAHSAFAPSPKGGASGEIIFPNQTLTKSISQGVVSPKDSKQSPDALLSPTASRFKKYQERKINDKVLQLIEEQKQVDRRKSVLIQNLLDTSYQKIQRSNSKASENKESIHSNHSYDEASKSQTALEQAMTLSVPPKRTHRQSVFYNTNSALNPSSSLNMYISSIQVNSQTAEDVNMYTSVTKDDEINMQTSGSHLSKVLQPSISQIISPPSEKKTRSPKHTVSISNNMISGSKLQLSPTIAPFSLKVMSSPLQKPQNLKEINDKTDSLCPNCQQQEQFKLETQQIQKPVPKMQIYSDYYNKTAIKHRQKRKKVISSFNQNISNTIQTSKTNITDQPDQIIEHCESKVQSMSPNHKKHNKSSDLHDKSVNSRHENCKQLYQKSLVDFKSATASQEEAKELSKLRKAQFLEKFYIDIIYNKASQQSINNENGQFINLEPHSLQLKELMEQSPRIIYKNMNNVINFKKRFLKILNSQPQQQQKKMFDFQTGRDNYLFRKLRSNTRLINNQVFKESANKNAFSNEMLANQDNIFSKEELYQQSNQHFKSKTESSFKDPLNDQGGSNRNINIQQNSNQKSNNNIQQSGKDSVKQSFRKLLNPMDDILKFINNSKKKNDNSSMDMSQFDRLRLESSVSQASQSIFDFKSNGNSFSHTLKNQSFFNSKKPLSVTPNSISQPIKIIMETPTSVNHDYLDQNNLSIQPEGGYVKKLSILSSKSQRSANIIQKNFSNKFSHIMNKIDPINDSSKQSEHKIQKQIELNSNSSKYKSTQSNYFKTFQTERSNSRDTKSTKLNNNSNFNKIETPQDKQVHKLASINFSTNSATGITQDSDYIISTNLSQRKTVLQRIKEQQIKQKGGKLQSKPQYILKNLQLNHNQKFKEDQTVVDKQQNSTFSLKLSQSNSDFFSQLSPNSSDQVYLFQNISPSRVIKRHS